MERIRFAVIGAGGFARFAVAEFVKVEGVQLVGVYDEDAATSQKLNEVLDQTIPAFSSLEQLLADPGIDLVYIATPPYLHYPQSKAALLAGKHVICEKPAAIDAADAAKLRTLAREKKLLYVVNLMQRYNPLYHSVTSLIREKLLGEVLHGFFENYASDEYLPASHWFWDTEQSGGIFIEHGVHFFDMAEGWLGKGRVVAAQKIYRAGYENVCDKFQAIVQYGDCLFNFYHGFDQPKVMDRQELRLQFEHGEITLYEWVPTRLKMTALCTEQTLDKLKAIFPGATITMIETHDQPRTVRGRFKDITFQHKIALDTGDAVQKQTLYQELVTSMFTDQITWIRDRSHVRVIDEDNAVASLEMAEEAEAKA